MAGARDIYPARFEPKAFQAHLVRVGIFASANFLEPFANRSRIAAAFRELERERADAFANESHDRERNGEFVAKWENSRILNGCAQCNLDRDRCNRDVFLS